MRKPLFIGIGVFVAAWLANLAAGELLGYPFVYCLSRPLAPLSAPVFYWLWIAAVVVFMVTMFRGRNFLASMGMVVLLAGLPLYLETLFLGWMGCGT